MIKADKLKDLEGNKNIFSERSVYGTAWCL